MSDSEKINSQDILNAIDMNKINQTEKKRRGRPKKTQMISPNPKIKIPLNDNDSMEEDEIILHLPISRDDIKSLGLSSTIEDTVEKLRTNESEEESSSDKEIKNTDPTYKHLGLIIKKLKDENDELKKFLTDITPMYFTEVKIYPVDLQLINLNNGTINTNKTNICCWWCTHNFECLPTFMPEKFSDNKFYVSGCFCSFNCAGAYNLNINDSKVWERYSLLKQLYYMINKDKIVNITDIEINIAGPRELLEKFGGPMTITEYRKNSKILGREYHKLIPPFLPTSMGFEETTNSKISKNVNINSLISSKNDNVLIKRNKPVNNIASKNIDHYIE
jgi:hypothetical protein